MGHKSVGLAGINLREYMLLYVIWGISCPYFRQWVISCHTSSSDNAWPCIENRDIPYTIIQNSFDTYPVLYTVTSIEVFKTETRQCSIWQECVYDTAMELEHATTGLACLCIETTIYGISVLSESYQLVFRFQSWYSSWYFQCFC